MPNNPKFHPYNLLTNKTRIRLNNASKDPSPRNFNKSRRPTPRNGGRSIMILRESEGRTRGVKFIKITRAAKLYMDVDIYIRIYNHTARRARICPGTKLRLMYTHFRRVVPISISRRLSPFLPFSFYTAPTRYTVAFSDMEITSARRYRHCRWLCNNGGCFFLYYVCDRSVMMLWYWVNFSMEFEIAANNLWRVYVAMSIDVGRSTRLEGYVSCKKRVMWRVYLYFYFLMFFFPNLYTNWKYASRGNAFL